MTFSVKRPSLDLGFWQSRKHCGPLLGNISDADMLNLLEENESNQPDIPSPFLFWMVFGADPAPFREEHLCLPLS